MRGAGQTIAAHERQPIAESQLVGGVVQGETVQRRDDRRRALALVQGELELAIRPLEALGLQTEAAALVKHPG
jgi:hypothetical protein